MENNKKGKVKVRAIYKKFLIAAIAIYVIGSSVTQAALCYRIGELEHELAHVSHSFHK